MAIGKRILARLQTLGWERRDLLDRVEGLTPQALHNLIKRDSKRSEWDIDIAHALGVPVVWLVYGEEHYPAAVPISMPRAAEPENSIVDRITSIALAMPAEARAILLGRAQEIAAIYPPPPPANRRVS